MDMEIGMRFALVALLGALIVTPAAAQGYYGGPGYYGYRPDAWSTAREEWHRAHRAQEIARWRAMNGDYEGANRAQYWAERHREIARQNAGVARGGW
jgi:hypothetical protein